MNNNTFSLHISRPFPLGLFLSPLCASCPYYWETVISHLHCTLLLVSAIVWKALRDEQCCFPFVIYYFRCGRQPSTWKSTSTILSKAAISNHFLVNLFFPQSVCASGAGAKGAHHPADGEGLTRHSWVPSGVLNLKLEQGDWVFWAHHPSTPCSHLAESSS